MDMPPVVSKEEWDAARQSLLVREKALTRARDAMAAERRRMPRLAVEKEYAFEGPNGPARLRDLFEGRRQLVVYRFFYEPGVASYPETGCRGCSQVADQVGHLSHDDEDRVFRTYLVDRRGDEAMGSYYSYLDITALGRQETWEDSPAGYPQTAPYVWINLHDEYDDPTEFAQAASDAAASQRGSRYKTM